jgi:hypothetical protein
MGVSNRAYARLKGVSESSVRKAIKAGRLTPLADGTLDPAVADQQWSRNTNVRLDTNVRRDTDARVDTHVLSSTSEPVKAPASGSLLQARTASEIVRAQTGKVRLARLKGELIDRNQAIAQIFKLARTERDAWINWPARISAEMAATLSVDAHKMHIALESAVREHLQELGALQPRFE